MKAILRILVGLGITIAGVALMFAVIGGIIWAAQYLPDFMLTIVWWLGWAVFIALILWNCYFAGSDFIK